MSYCHNCEDEFFATESSNEEYCCWDCEAEDEMPKEG